MYVFLRKLRILVWLDKHISFDKQVTSIVSHSYLLKDIGGRNNSLVVEAQKLGFVGNFFYQADTFPEDSLYHTCSPEKMPQLSRVGKPRFQAPSIMAPTAIGQKIKIFKI